MLKGFLTGSLALVILYAVSSEGGAEKIGIANTKFQIGMQRFFSPDVPLVRDREYMKTGYIFRNPSKFNYFDNPGTDPAYKRSQGNKKGASAESGSGNFVPATGNTSASIQLL